MPKKKSVRKTTAKSTSKKKRSPKKDPDTGINTDLGKTFYWQSNIRGSILTYYETYTIHNERKANWLLTLAGVLLVIILGQSQVFLSDIYTKIGAIAIVLGCLGCMFATILILIPKTEFLTNKDFNEKEKKNHIQKFDVYYFRDIQKHFTAETLAGYLKELRGDSLQLDKAYAYGIYWFANYRLPFVIQQLTVGGWSLFWGVALGSIFVLGGFLI